MSESTKHARILGFPSGVILSNGRVERLQQVNNNSRCDYILDYQELGLSSSLLFSEGNKVFEIIEGTYYPKRLRFHNIQGIKLTGLYKQLDSLPPEHISRSLHSALHWQPPYETLPLYLFSNGGDVPGSCLFSAQTCTLEKRIGSPTTISLTRNWSPAPTIPLGFVPVPKQLHKRYSGDPITIRLGKRIYHKRLFVGGLDIQTDNRPEVDAVLNLGEECSRWAISSSKHPVDRWVNKGEGKDGMNIDEIVTEAQWVIDHLYQGSKVLVHCVAGFNRSVTICCAILMLMENLSAERALMRVREHHPWALPDSNHWLMLRWLTQKLDLSY